MFPTMPVTHRSAPRHRSSVSARRLTTRECRDWLDSHHEGRLAYSTGRGPRSVVVNYAITSHQIMFRLPDYNDIVHYAPGERITLEVEGPQAAMGDFETVTVTGEAQLAGEHAPELAEADFVEQWPAGVSTSVLCLPMTQVEGFEHVGSGMSLVH
jgi:nitroimidazol reductase NimA-like FMN-containing flavoprotein (pyridoxamine 5'-phosphate oxidase superfamily)